jgi:protein-tyrosine phosphatase
MPDVIDWQTVPDPEEALRTAVAAIGAGRIVVLPTECGYVLAASSRSAPSREELRQLLLGAGEPISVGLSSEVVRREWVPLLGLIGRRFARRLWPGAVTLAIANPVGDGFPESVRDLVEPGDAIHLCSPAHEVVREALRLCPDPVLLVDASRLANNEPPTGARLAEALGARVALVIDDGPVQFPAGSTVIGLSGDCWHVLREGAVAADVVKRQTACLIVFVCTGNTCRSPLAESLFKKRLCERLGCSVAELPDRGYEVLSAGLAAYPGGPAALEAVAVAAAHGADLSGHQAQVMTGEMLLQADYVIGMTRDHVEALEEAAAGLGPAPRLLSPDGTDLPDPVGREQSVYDDCAAAIWEHVAVLAAEILAPSPSQAAST